MVTKSLTFVVCICIASAAVFADITYFAHQGGIDSVTQTGKGKKVGEGTVAEITSMGDQPFDGGWNIEFSGVMKVSKAGSYEFVITSDDSSALYVNDQEVVNNDGPHAKQSRKNSIKLEAGNHQINLLYFNRSGGHALSATVRPVEGPVQDLATVCSPSKKRLAFVTATITAAQKKAAEDQKSLLKISSPDALIRSISRYRRTGPFSI